MSKPLCKHHPTYKAKHRPRSTCLDCIKAYDRVREGLHTAAKAAERIADLYNTAVSVTVRIDGFDSIEYTTLRR